MIVAIDIGQLCVHCGTDTGPNSFQFINRISADTEWTINAGEPDEFIVNVIGWMCADCQCMPCEVCDQPVMDWETVHYQGTHVWACHECIDTKNLVPVTQPQP